MAICQAATPQFPQACGCVIERAGQAGIPGPVLSRLLANDVAGVPIEAVQAYGAIYVQCIQEAVLAGVPSAPQPQSPQPRAPSTAPITQAAAPSLRGRSYPGYRDGAAVEMSLRDPLAPGQWGFVSLSYPGVGLGGAGAHDGRGNLLLVRCGRAEFSGGALVLGGPDAAALGPFATVLVQSGNGAELYRRNLSAQAVEGGLAVIRNDQPMVDAIRAGARLIVASQAGGREMIFGLSGSNAAIGPGVCGTPDNDFRRYSALSPFVVDAAWEIRETNMPSLGPVVSFRRGLNMAPDFGLACDGRAVISTPVLTYAQPGEGWQAALALFLEDGGRIDAVFSVDADGVGVSALPSEVLEALARTSVLEVTFALDVEPGEFTVALYSAEGLAANVAANTCPVRADITAEPRIDLTGQGAWTGVDVGRLFNGMVETPPMVPAALFSGEVADKEPALFVECTGEPFLMAGEWGPGVGAPLRFVFDGDLGRAVEIDFFVARAQMFGGPEAEALIGPMLSAQTVRITSLSDPAIDVLYPLAGLSQALRGAGCS
ncbi:MAG: hypothetical protein AAFQ06_00290 [Pseudomonadota bacterium]